MTLASHLMAILCVALIAAGQVMFKSAARTLTSAGTVLDWQFLSIVGGALAIYAVATVFWIALLRDAPLGRAYPYMALSFILVAIASRFVFAETITVGQAAGLGLIVAGLVVAAAS